MGRPARSGPQWLGKEAGSSGHEDGSFWVARRQNFGIIAASVRVLQAGTSNFTFSEPHFLSAKLEEQETSQCRGQV